jgi:hypothetical protein
VGWLRLAEIWRRRANPRRSDEGTWHARAARLATIEQVLSAASPGPWLTSAHRHPTGGCRCLSCYDDPTGWLVDVPSQGLDCDELVSDAPGTGGRPRESCGVGPLLSYDDALLAARSREDVAWLLDLVKELLTERLERKLRWGRG